MLPSAWARNTVALPAVHVEHDDVGEAVAVEVAGGHAGDVLDAEVVVVGPSVGVAASTVV